MNVELFEAHRGRLTAIAYGMLGSVVDAEDVVQESWLRWAQRDRQDVERPEAFLTTITTRLAIDRLRSARHRRETYVGPWLPEPMPSAGDPADAVAEAERLSMALLTAMERLGPVERAVFLLREVFDFDYSTIADIVDRSPAACRQVAVRARDRIGDPHRARPSDEATAVVVAFLEALATGDVEQLVATLAADVVLWSDGGGKRRAARHPVAGADRVARFLINVSDEGRTAGGSARVLTVNGAPALLLEIDDAVVGVMTLDVTDGRVVAVRNVINPDKLTHLSR